VGGENEFQGKYLNIDEYQRTNAQVQSIITGRIYSTQIYNNVTSHTSVDEVGVLLSRLRVRPHAQQTVLALQHHLHARRHVVRGHRRHSNAWERGMMVNNVNKKTGINTKTRKRMDMCPKQD